MKTDAGLVHKEEKKLLGPDELAMAQNRQGEGPSRLDRPTRKGNLGRPRVGKIVRDREGRRA